MSEKRYKPGETVPRSGQAAWRGQEVTVVKGEPFPPTGAAGRTWKMVDYTKHKGK